MNQQFKIYKEGTTSGKILIISKDGEPFNKSEKIKKYLFLGYKVYDLQDNEILKA